MRQVPNAPGFDNVVTLLPVICWLLLEAPKCRGKLRSSDTVIVASYSYWKLMFLVGRLIGVCSLLTMRQNLGSQHVFGIGSARWPEGPLPSGVTQRFYLIPVSGVREAVNGNTDEEGCEKIRGKGIEGTFNKDMTNNGMILRHTYKSSIPWAKRVVTSGVRRRAQREKVRVCAYGEVLSVQRSRRSLAARFDQGQKCPLCKAQRVRAGASRGVLVFWQTRGFRPLMWSGIPERHIHCAQNHLFTKGWRN